MDRVLLSEAIGTTGYMDPSILKTGGITYKSDVYSFGVVLCEILCGRKAFISDVDNRFLAPLFRVHYEKGSLDDIIDPDLRNQMAEKSLYSFSEAAYSCLKEERLQRPDMKHIVNTLKEALELQQPLENLKNRDIASARTMFSDLQIPLEEVVKATNNFAVENIIGQGGFGNAYKGNLMHSGGLINIVARRLDRKYGQGDIEFWTEISVLSSLKHENLVFLIGFCDENGEKVIINMREASKGSLSMYLSDMSLTWIQRLKICAGVANALKYIHNGEGRGYSVIHRNINSSTILLDDNFEAKLSGFEFSIKQLVNQMDRVLLSEAIGTTGYMDPSIQKTGGVTYKSDIYSFGVVLCEILCGRKAFILDVDNRFLAPLFRVHYEKGSLNDIIHPDLRYQMTHKSLTSFSEAAYCCLKEERLQRPDMKRIVNTLKEALELQQPLENLRKNFEHLKIRLSDMMIPLSDIMLATDNFSKACHIEYTGYCNLYRAELEYFDKEKISLERNNKGELCRTRNTVVVKRFALREDENGEEVFFTEIEMLITCKHPNIVKLLGVCHEGSEMILVVENLSNGYLGDFWKNTNGMPILTWAKRLKICLEVANALNYLHTEMEDQKMIIHRDIRSDNIALDENWGAKIVNFGLSIFMSPNQDDEALHQNIIVGTNTYIDPEYAGTGKLKRESDVYSFGVVLFEVLCGRLAYDPIYKKESDELGLAFVARRCLQEGALMEMMDPILKKESGENSYILNRGPKDDSLYKFVKVAYQCVEESQDRRPTMKEVIKRLQKALFFQEQQLQHSDMVQDVNEVQISIESKSQENSWEQTQPIDVVPGLNEVEELMELNLTREENSSEKEDKTQRPDMVQVVAKDKISKELKLTNANSIKKLEHLKISLSDIMLATDNFCKAYHLENTTYYELYRAELEHFDEENSSIKEGKDKGELPSRRSTAVIKRILPREDKEGEKVFYTEIIMLDTCKHPSIIKLLGFCNEGSEMILVVEHLSKGYLADYWNNIKDMPVLTWEKRLKICLDVAHGLNYLHSEMEDQKMIIHGDINSGNIALDENWGAKIIDFGFSVFLPPNEDDNALDLEYVSGTQRYQYMDPEYRETGKLKKESDVYSFGVVLFEVLCGRLAYDPIYLKESDELGQIGLAFLAWRCFREGTVMEMIDPILKEGSGENNYILKKGPNKDSLNKFIEIAHECITRTHDQSPKMKVIIQELQEALFLHENSNDNPIILLEEIELATQNFHDDNCVGGGGFGKVYRGKLREGDGNNTIVAKRLDKTLGQGEHQFRNELQILYEYKHEKLIRLVGYCDEKNEQIIVYEYASKGSLDGYLKDVRLTWMKRLKICIDVATALAFLHGGAGKQAIVIHRDIKTANILLTDEWDAKLADFGLSLISPINKKIDYVIDHACGTRGYLDPLYLKSGFLTIESDIYSFGVVLFEILCGRSTFEIHKHKGQFLPGFIKECFEKGKHHELVYEAIKEQTVPEALIAFQTIAYQCLDDDREKRPTAKEALKQLKGALLVQITRSQHLKIPLSDILLATDNFSNAYQLAATNLSKLYRADLEHFDKESFASIEGKNKGEIPKRRSSVVIKRILPREDEIGEELFTTEIEMLTTCKHPNIVTLHGYCDEGSELILITEHLSNGYLSDYWRNTNDMPILTWAKRLKICLDVAHALNYLHNEMEDQKRVIHHDIRSNHIALDENWGAKIVSFALSVFLPPNQDNDTLHLDPIFGSYTYIDPEYRKTGKLKRESDVYNFGVVLFEALCGRLSDDPIYLKETDGVGLAFVARRSFQEGTLTEMIDPLLKEQRDENSFILNREPNEDSLEKFIKIAHECIAETQDQRPTMKVVIKELQKAILFEVYADNDGDDDDDSLLLWDDDDDGRC